MLGDYEEKVLLVADVPLECRRYTWGYPQVRLVEVQWGDGGSRQYLLYLPKSTDGEWDAEWGPYTSPRSAKAAATRILGRRLQWKMPSAFQLNCERMT